MLLLLALLVICLVFDNPKCSWSASWRASIQSVMFVGSLLVEVIIYYNLLLFIVDLIASDWECNHERFNLHLSGRQCCIESCAWREIHWALFWDNWRVPNWLLVLLLQSNHCSSVQWPFLTMALHWDPTSQCARLITHRPSVQHQGLQWLLRSCTFLLSAVIWYSSGRDLHALLLYDQECNRHSSLQNFQVSVCRSLSCNHSRYLLLLSYNYTPGCWSCLFIIRRATIRLYGSHR